MSRLNINGAVLEYQASERRVWHRPLARSREETSLVSEYSATPSSAMMATLPARLAKGTGPRQCNERQRQILDSGFPPLEFDRVRRVQHPTLLIGGEHSNPVVPPPDRRARHVAARRRTIRSTRWGTRNARGQSGCIQRCRQRVHRKTSQSRVVQALHSRRDSFQGVACFAVRAANGRQLGTASSPNHLRLHARRGQLARRASRSSPSRRD